MWTLERLRLGMAAKAPAAKEASEARWVRESAAPGPGALWTLERLLLRLVGLGMTAKASAPAARDAREARWLWEGAARVPSSSMARRLGALGSTVRMKDRNPKKTKSATRQTLRPL